VLRKGQRANLTVIGLENYRKRFDREGELLIRYQDGRRDWTYAVDAKHDAKAEMYKEALKKFKITDGQLKFGLSKLHEVAIKKQKQILKQKKENDSNKKQKGGNFFI
jgi:N-methylhydantoinase A/oxoprolinase/acetone carboxylase beta subunit